MPLVSGNTQAAISENIHRLMMENKKKSKPRPHDQIIAIALEQSRKKK